MKILLLLIVICIILKGGEAAVSYPTLVPSLKTQAYRLLQHAQNLVHDSDRRVGKLWRLRLNSQLSAPFEIGFLNFILEERYRRMVDKYFTCKAMDKRLYHMELVVYLEEIEQEYWTVEHFINMQHEIEKKYKMFNTSLYETFKETSTTSTVSTRRTWTFGSTLSRSINPNRKVKLRKVKDYLARLTTTARKKRVLWDRIYGWEIDMDLDEFLQEKP